MAYDLDLRERAEVMGPSIFCYGDHELTHQWLGVDALRSSTPCSSANSSAMSKKQASTKRWSGYCWQWNENKTSRQVPCKFRHVCSKCQGEHKSVDCLSKSDSAASASAASASEAQTN